MVLHKVSARIETECQTVLYSYQTDKLFHYVSYGVTHSHLGIGMWKKTEWTKGRGKD